ncbi:hypothetical protein [Aureispira sp. CCB-QB1]|uniref:hypothetical protein n=1 Tax=Aureispira sp. CCB-QB1 TaxID=1313421 RepID=UPI000698F191|nr:hypothetical protein [Aureispira sp. CCB-QB1]
MQETKKTNAKNVGSFISNEYFQFLTGNFKNHFPSINNATCIIPCDLIYQTLQSSDKITGIRFMYGLRDLLNPNSIHLFLVPCVTPADDVENWSPLVSKSGYYNHQGDLFTITEVAEMVHNFVGYYAEGIHATYKDATRGIYFGINSLLGILNIPQTHSIQFHLGLKDKTIPAVLQPLDQLGQPIPDIYMDYGQLDPDSIPDAPCIATLAVETLSIEKELNLFRAFRDTSMRDYLYGGMLYEMYYFISPFVTSVIAHHPNKNELLKDLYNNAITPFRILIQNEKHQEALFLLKRALEDLVNTHQVSYALA